MTLNSFLPTLRVSGTNHKIGLEVGRKFKDRIKQAFDQSVIYKHLKEQDRLKPEWFDRLHEYAKNHFPHYLDEISGIAEGANLEYRDVAIINFRGSFPQERVGCSTVIFKNQDQIIFVHNEDHEAILGELAYLLVVELVDGPIFFSYTYPGCLPGFSFSFNSFGIVQSANAMPDPDLKMGVPRHLLDRSMLEASNINDILQRAQMSPRSGGFSYNLASMKEKRVINLETTSERTCVTEIQDCYVHTNHYVSDELKDIPSLPGSTEDRYNRGRELLSGTKKSAKEALNILFDDKIFLPSRKRPGLYGMLCSGTLCTAFFDISEDITLQIFPPTRKKEESIEFTLSDLI